MFSSKKPIVFMLVSIIAGCGSSNSGESPELEFREFTASDYFPVENSQSIEGTWIAVSNGEEKDEDGEEWSETKFSKISFYTIKKIESDYFISSCESGFRVLSYSEDSSIIYVNEQENGAGPHIIEDNNRFKGVSSFNDNPEYYSYHEFDHIKVSNSTDSLGDLSLSWSGNTDNIDEISSIDALCQESVSRVNHLGLVSNYYAARVHSESNTEVYLLNGLLQLITSDERE